jgi:hypothetical protein
MLISRGKPSSSNTSTVKDNAADVDDGAYDIAAQASAAWEAAVCWDDEYAVKRLAEVRAV